MRAAVPLIFFASGAAALIFETLWFRQTGLVLGNTVWASALVMASFMGGLAAGNAIALRTGFRLARPLRFFAALELVVAATGAGLLFLLPWLSQTSAPLLATLGGTALDTVRLMGSFLLLVVPASAMGATLPVLARSLGARDANFGRVLGRLYGWNTLGAVAGTWCAEAWLVPALGIRGAGFVAAGLDVLAAMAAVLIDRRLPSLPAARRRPEGLPPAATRLGLAAFAAGGLLLALEVVWFRFLAMFIATTTTTFATMLGVVLAGIAGGALLGSAWLGRRPGDWRHAPLIALAAGISVSVTYAFFDARRMPVPGITFACAFLMLPTCLCSGLLFTFLGRSLHDHSGEETEAAGVLTLSNTAGAMLGSLLAGFVLLPLVGMERALFGLAVGYGVAAWLAGGVAAWRSSRALQVGSALFAVTLVLFPFGRMTERHVRALESHFAAQRAPRVVAMREGLGETVFLLRTDFAGAPLYWRLLTNVVSMSTTDFKSRRYMGFFVWWPVALHAEPRRALLISYGVGNTARALTATRSLTHIDVVDVSADVLAMSATIWPGAENPLRDPRVRVHIEDGRFVLLTSRERYDIITGEPPPPKLAGIVSLYSREYFRLMRDRLADGGVATYWLPVHQLAPRETWAVARAFCDAFEDCSLWSGFSHEWMLVGTRALQAPVTPDHFARQWADPVAAARLRAAGLDSPAHLGTTFLGDAAYLKEVTAAVPAVVDNWPYRIDPRLPGGAPEYLTVMQTAETRRRFETSDWVRRIWPSEWRTRTLAAFESQALLNTIAWAREGLVAVDGLALQHRALTGQSEAVALWALNTSVEEQEVAARQWAAGATAPKTAEVLGLGALARQDYAEAESLLGRAEPHAQHPGVIRRLRILARGMAGDRAGAVRLYTDAAQLRRASRTEPEAAAWGWLAAHFGLEPAATRPF